MKMSLSLKLWKKKNLSDFSWAMKIQLSLGKSSPHSSNGILTQGNLSLTVGAVGLPLTHHLQANLAMAPTLLMLS